YPDSDLARFYTLGVDAVFMGHTHRPFINTVGKTLVVNVGSCGLPRDHGELSSCAVFDTDSGECRILRIPFDAQSVLRTVPRPVHPAVISSFARKEPQKPFGVLAE
ncbi:MAG: metallophosphoesterase family protein, partial [Waddliaceae bacterium]